MARTTALCGVLVVSCATPPRSGETTWRTVALGLCEDYPEETRTLAAARADLELAREVGAKTLCIAFGWDAMAPAPGEFDWSFWDEFVPLAVERFGLRLIPYVCYTPKWAATDQGENFWRAPPRETREFEEFCDALVTRYRRWIKSWELWNEPDNPAYWSGTPAQFAELVRAGSAGVRRADPAAKIVLGGIAWNVEFLENLFRDEHLAPAVDVVNLHSYFETWHASPIEELPRYVAQAGEVVRKFGEREPLWLAETGYSSVGARAAVSEVYRAHYRNEHTERAQADALARTLVLALASDLDLVAWYRINDLPPSEGVIGDDNNRHLGLRRIGDGPKPAAKAFSLLAHWFRQPYRVATHGVEFLSEQPSRTQVHLFTFANGDGLLAAWLGMPGGVPAGEPSEDTRGERLRILLVDSPFRAGQACDVLGEAVSGFASRAVRRGLELTLPLRQSEVVWVTLRTNRRN